MIFLRPIHYSNRVDVVELLILVQSCHMQIDLQNNPSEESGLSMLFIYHTPVSDN